MTVDQLEAWFSGEQADREFIAFDRIANKRSQRANVYAFMLLDEIIPGTRDMVCAAEHDEIYLDIEPEALAAVATEELLVELSRCGVRCGESGLCMFV